MDMYRSWPKWEYDFGSYNFMYQNGLYRNGRVPNWPYPSLIHVCSNIIHLPKLITFIFKFTCNEDTATYSVKIIPTCVANSVMSDSGCCDESDDGTVDKQFCVIYSVADYDVCMMYVLVEL